jgi:hypothetical protein
METASPQKVLKVFEYKLMSQIGHRVFRLAQKHLWTTHKDILIFKGSTLTDTFPADYAGNIMIVILLFLLKYRKKIKM